MIAQQPAVFPQYADDIRELVEDHRTLEDERLLLAIYYAPADSRRPQQDVYLFEVYDGYHQNRVGDTNDWQEVLFGTTPAFPLPREQYLHVVLTNPAEFAVGLERGWPLACEVKQAIASGRFQVVYLEPGQEALLEQLRA